MSINSRHLHNICEGFNLHFLILAHDGSIQYASWLAKNFFNLKCNKRFADFLDPCSRDAFQEHFKTAVQNRGHVHRKINAVIAKTLYTLDLKFYAPPGESICVYLYITPNQANKDHATLSIEEKLSVIGRLSDGIAHNLRSPLMVLRNIADYMAMVGNLWEQIYADRSLCRSDCPIQSGKDKIGKLLEQMRIDIYNNVTVMTDIIDDLRAYNKNDRLNEIASINVIDLLKQVIKVLDYNTKLAVSVILLKPTEAIPNISCVPSDIQVVFTNIIENAIEQIILKKVKKGRIEVSVVKQNNSVAIKIKDNGGGIDKVLTATNKLFEPFVTTKKVGGTGLGLHSSFKIIKEHGGNIYAKNHRGKIGKGAEFTVILPLEQI